MLVIALLGIGLLVAWQWTYIDHLWHHPRNQITDVAWYSPKEAVPGGGGVRLPRSAAGEVRIEPQALEEAARLADEKNSSALMVVHEGRVALERNFRGYRPGDWTNSASMAKTINAILVGIAIEEGRIKSIGEPAAAWLPAWRGDVRRKITIRHLLQMHSGLQREGEYADPFSDASYLALGTDLRYVVDNIPAVEEPGTRFDYNNVNFQALGFILEAATGRRYAEYLSEKLWKPIGAGNAAFWLDREGGSVRTFGYLFATPEDWARVGLLLLHDGRQDSRQIIPRSYLRSMLTPSPTEPRYGLGIWLAHNPTSASKTKRASLSTASSTSTAAPSSGCMWPRGRI